MEFDLSTISLSDPTVIAVIVIVILAIIGVALYFTGYGKTIAEKVGF